MLIDFEKDSWDAILKLPDEADLDSEDRQFLLKTLTDWQKGDLSIHLSTSGSTGPPSSITLDESLIRWNVHRSTDHLGLAAKQFVYCCLPVSKTGGAMQLARAYLNRWKIQVTRPSANPLKDLDEGHEFTLISLTPLQAGQILSEADSARVLSGFRTVLIGGGGIGPGLRDQLIRLTDGQDRLRIFQTYGMTETAGHIALADIRDDGMFTPMEGVEVRTDDRGTGVITIQPLDKTVTTTDLLALEGKHFRITGRHDFMVNTGGLKLNPEDLENKIVRLAGKQKMPEFYFHGLPDPDLGQRLVLIVEGDRDQGFEALVNQTLKGAERPKAVYYTADFKYTTTGKLDRQGTANGIFGNH